VVKASRVFATDQFVHQNGYGGNHFALCTHWCTHYSTAACRLQPVRKNVCVTATAQLVPEAKMVTVAKI